MRRRCQLTTSILGLFLPFHNAFQVSQGLPSFNSMQRDVAKEIRSVAFPYQVSSLSDVVDPASTSTTSDIALSSPARDTKSFVSRPTQLYIEDTDAYGVMYYANYIRAYERALHEFSYQNQQQQISKPNDDDERIEKGSILNYSDFTITQVTSHKFKSSPTLGSEFVISAEKIENADDISTSETWSLEMIEYGNDESTDDESDSERSNKRKQVFNTATVTITRPPTVSPLYHPPSFQIDKHDPKTHPLTLENTFPVHRDDFDIHMPETLSVHSILKLFERSRTNGLGGPQILRQMQEEDNILWVVTSTDNLKINSSATSRPGQSVNVKSHVAMKRKGMILEFLQSVEAPAEDDQSEGVMVAQGVVTVCAIDSRKGRPTSKIPDHVRAYFE